MSNPDKIKNMTWKGQQIKNMSREELIEALHQCAKMYVQAREEAHQNKMREIDLMEQLGERRNT